MNPAATSGSIAILGAGSWGTAVAIHLARHHIPVVLWAHQQQHALAMRQARQNQRYLPDQPFPKTLTVTADLALCLQQATQVIVAVPSQAFADVLAKLNPKPPHGLAWLTKGIDPDTHELLSTRIAARWGSDYPYAVISGPSFAGEVAQALPTALVLAGNEAGFLKVIRDVLHRGSVRVYVTDDAQGVQLCGAVKNILAIACGISDGLQFGANAKAALITRGLAEMRRLGLSLGAKAETFMGLAGVGDLVLTCTDNQSRNRRFGLQVGQGVSIPQAELQIGQVVEGKHNCAQICALAQQHQVEMPICEAVNAILLGKISPKQAVSKLMTRPPKME